VTKTAVPAMTVGLRFEVGSEFWKAEESTPGVLANLPEMSEKMSAVELSLQDEYSPRKIAVNIK
jgi:hypothetical protein